MKKGIVIAGISVLILASCNKKAEPVEPVEPVETVKEEGPTQAEALADSTSVDGTSVSVSSDGVKISDTENEKKVEVKATKDGASVEIKK